MPQSQNAPKCPQNTQKKNMPQNTSNYLRIPQHAPKYVLQDYRGVGRRAHLPPKPEALIPTQLERSSILDAAKNYLHASLPVGHLQLQSSPTPPTQAFISIQHFGPSASEKKHHFPFTNQCLITRECKNIC